MPGSQLSDVSTTDLQYAEKFSAPHSLDKQALRRLMEKRAQTAGSSGNGFEEAVRDAFRHTDLPPTLPLSAPPRVVSPRVEGPADWSRAGSRAGSRNGSRAPSPVRSRPASRAPSPPRSTPASRVPSPPRSRPASRVPSRAPSRALSDEMGVQQLAEMRAAREHAERRFFYNELEALKQSGVQVGEFSLDSSAHDLEFRFNHSKRLESEKESQESAEQFFKISLKVLELGNRKFLKGVLPLNNFSRDTIRDIDRFRPALHRIATKYMCGPPAGSQEEEPLRQLGRLMLIHVASFCLSKYLHRSDEPAVAAERPVGPPSATGRRRPVLSGP